MPLLFHVPIIYLHALHMRWKLPAFRAAAFFLAFCFCQVLILIWKPCRIVLNRKFKYFYTHFYDWTCVNSLFLIFFFFSPELEKLKINFNLYNNFFFLVCETFFIVLYFIQMYFFFCLSTKYVLLVFIFLWLPAFAFPSSPPSDIYVRQFEFYNVIVKNNQIVVVLGRCTNFKKKKSIIFVLSPISRMTFFFRLRMLGSWQGRFYVIAKVLKNMQR